MTTPRAGRPNPARREPLWVRVERNRFRLVAYLVAFALVTAVFSAFVIAGVALLVLLFAGGGSGDGALTLIARWVLEDGPWRAYLLALAGSVIYELWAVARPERWLLRRLGATIIPKGEHLAAKMALKDMAVASGLTVAPSMHLLETSNVNAFVFKAPGRRPVLGVTAGLLDRFSVDEQRAVFANLTARVISGDTLVSSVVASLLDPLNRFRSYRLRALDAEDRLMRDALESRKYGTGEPTQGGLPASAFFIPVLFPFVLAGEILAAAQRRSHLVASEKADAEGMLLLKHPQPMLSALEQAIRLNNNVTLADETLGDLFYCWTGDSTDDESDPEWRRVARLREVLGADGWVPDETDDAIRSEYLPPPAPRLEK